MTAKADANAHGTTNGSDITGLERIKAPELVIGLVAPVGTRLDTIEAALAGILGRYRYAARPIKLTEEIGDLSLDGLAETEGASDRLSKINAKMDAGNTLRSRTGRQDAMAAVAVLAIRRARQALNATERTADEAGGGQTDAETADAEQDGSKQPRSRQAYIVRQLKRPEEVETLRLVYGPAFLLIGAHEPRSDREKRLADQHAQDKGHRRSEGDDSAARQVIGRDEDESGSPFGQRLSDTYHLADAIVDARTPERSEAQLERILDAFFGRPFTTPTRSEYFLNMARQVALRSADLSRQVGAVVVGTDEAILGAGCNEVPKPGGGSYWEGDDPDMRDFRLGYDPSAKQKQAILGDALQRLGKADWLAERYAETARDTPGTLVAQATAKAQAGPLAGAHVADLLEFGRVVHAEMNALAEAARSGRSVAGASLYCTTFPCHMCARHIVAAGIRRVVYLEPYPKSLALELHRDAIVEGSGSGDQDDRVAFEPFIGVAPPLFGRLFEWGNRKKSDGDIVGWKSADATPRITMLHPTYIAVEDTLIAYFYDLLIRAGLAAEVARAPATV